jgi:hypothetical protein
MYIVVDLRVVLKCLENLAIASVLFVIHANNIYFTRAFSQSGINYIKYSCNVKDRLRTFLQQFISGQDTSNFRKRDSTTISHISLSLCYPSWVT